MISLYMDNILFIIIIIMIIIDCIGEHMSNGEQGRKSCWYPFTTPASRETIVDKMPCLGAYALSATQTHDPLITSREYELIYYSAST